MYLFTHPFVVTTCISVLLDGLLYVDIDKIMNLAMKHQSWDVHTLHSLPLCKEMFHYHVHKNLSFYPALSQFNKVFPKDSFWYYPPTTAQFLTHPVVSLLGDPWPNICMHLSFPPAYYISHNPLFNNSNNTRCWEEDSHSCVTFKFSICFMCKVMHLIICKSNTNPTYHMIYQSIRKLVNSWIDVTRWQE